ncbi:hypothetical protein J2S71_002091 [Olsenella profusa DSM 13989]|uniref:Uncharacterized protein n=1 Tax=Olsenella profusa F0195 TaxID=1125712 RepID=U2V6V4_9ACTN|nr:hypothetical protein [Olsenella profusa]ERL08356.1 hypothetical protein HMPREF1316_0257 [Olsenella profusa F0195]MDP9860395.1 hypothetical protein [Olsenella profusa DSM 13989]
MDDVEATDGPAGGTRAAILDSARSAFLEGASPVSRCAAPSRRRA